jgi:RNA polymerase sigma-70 factor, ECF subfamily
MAAICLPGYAQSCNEFVSDLRRRVREREGLMIMDANPVAMLHSDPEVSCGVRELQHVFAKLPSWQQEGVLRVGVEGEEYGEPAIALGILIGTVRSRLARARETLRTATDHHSPSQKTRKRLQAAA